MIIEANANDSPSSDNPVSAIVSSARESITNELLNDHLNHPDMLAVLHRSAKCNNAREESQSCTDIYTSFKNQVEKLNERLEMPIAENLELYEEYSTIDLEEVKEKVNSFFPGRSYI